MDAKVRAAGKRTSEVKPKRFMDPQKKNQSLDVSWEGNEAELCTL